MCCEITTRNFSEKYPDILHDLRSASFIAIDCELSGLFDDGYKNSLFDSPKKKYQLIQQSVQNFSIIQFGLSTFTYEKSANKFISSSYSFYLVPSTILLENSKINCQMSSLEFLCKNKFNFNTLFYNGLCYLNAKDEDKVMKLIEEGTLFCSVDSLQVQKYFMQLTDWYMSASNNTELMLNLEDEKELTVCALHQEIRKRFLNVWTYFESDKIIKVKKITDSQRVDLVADEDKQLVFQKKVFDMLLGFSKVLKEIERLQKPIIGHNCFIDFIMIYKQFYNPTSVSYKQFKDDISRIFPQVYDTKFLSYELKGLLYTSVSWKSNSLMDLYSYFKHGKGSTLVLFTPAVKHKNDTFQFEKFHDAGFDAYCAGYCFIKIAFILTLWDKKRKSLDNCSIPVTISWLLGAVSNMKNHIHSSRSQVHCVVLDGPDPKSTRPNWLHIESTVKEPLDISKISQCIGNHPLVDIKVVDTYRGVLAVINQRQVEEIYRCFKGRNEYKITEYNFIKHSILGRSLLASGIAGASFLLIFVLSKTLIKR